MSLLEFVFRVVGFNAMAFGNGPVMIPLIRESFVGPGKLTEEQLLFSFTIGQVVPGQANLYVAAIGYLLFGVGAAFLSILAINLPGYLMLPLVRWHERMHDLPAARHFIRGLTSASVGLIFASTAGIARHTLDHPVSWFVFLATLASILLLRRSPPVSLALAGASGMVVLSLI